MKNRIRKIIEVSDIKKTEFARKINVSPPFVSELCSGAKSPSDRTVADICRVFNVSERWLRTGEGEMFKQISEAEELEQIFAAIAVSDDNLIKRAIRAYWRLSDNEKAAMQKMVDNLLEEAEQPAEVSAPATAQQSQLPELAAQPKAPKPNPPIPKGSTPEIEAELEAMRQEMIAEKNAQRSRPFMYGNAG